MSILKNSKLKALLLVLALSVSVFVGCSKSENDVNKDQGQEQSTGENKESDKLEGAISLAGSTSVTPYAEQLAEAFKSKNPNVEIDIQGLGSSAGIKAASDGTADIGMSSREIKEDEKGLGLTEHVIAHEGIAVVTHPSNQVKDLNMDQIKKIFKGEIKNWKEVGGKDAEILLVSREAGSGTRGAFEELVGLEEKNADGKNVSVLSKEALIADANGAVKQNIASKENAIGYLSLAYVDKSVKPITIEGVEPKTETVLSKEYKISRSFLLLTKGEENNIAKAYIDFILSPEGQKIVKEKGSCTC
ncbi:phosphate-binding protein PstS [Gottschalkia acidurici 9a]|uniref:Phosphate-binding protein n=1 Tax=Gottschalkia acidurici (strain ATCC 7906 / DSM 604 / BCRC 14475 / CIP 104303 / KCTC 5404 / NCIMB 10678 / 9a) TaxID=1128398 RepID=K0AZZ7_GOTA9|nr:phosphate ABC transporter substrate-binding protein [Gottschalkia acidurici]AFS78295.1 phosphate-binding protein PstS [Gottschalkia acidurici 9a]